MGKSALQHSERELLLAWGNQVEAMFGGAFQAREHFAGVFHVGSSVYARDYRDVDVRLILDDKAYRRLIKLVDTEYLRLGVSLWGQRVTGLPIDFDVQPMSYANKKYPSDQYDRSSIGIKVSAIHNTIATDILNNMEDKK